MKKSHDRSIYLSGDREVLERCVKQSRLQPPEHPNQMRIDTQAFGLGEETQKPPRRMRSILVVVDNLKRTSLLKQAFARAAIPTPVIFLERGQTAIDYLNREYPFADENANPWPGLMILDLCMAGISGVDLLLWMRNRARVCEIPVMVTGEIDRPTEISLAYALGAKLFLPKIDDVGQWARNLYRVVEMYGLSEEPAAVSRKGSCATVSPRTRERLGCLAVSLFLADGNLARSSDVFGA